MIPREGGNALKGSFFGSYVNSSFQGSNYTDELKAKGVRSPDAIREAYDYNPSVGGPVMRDRLWFFGSFRFLGNSNYVTGIFVNKNAGNPMAWNYDPDLEQPAFTNSESNSGNVRLTWQASQRNKFSFFHDHQYLCRCSLVTFSRPPESALRITYPIVDFSTVGWTAPVTAKLLFEARGGLRRESFMQPPRPVEGNPFLEMIDVTEQGGTSLASCIDRRESTDSTRATTTAPQPRSRTSRASTPSRPASARSIWTRLKGSSTTTTRSATDSSMGCPINSRNGRHPGRTTSGSPPTWASSSRTVGRSVV